MDHIFEHYKKTGYLHHAHVIVGSYEDISSLLLSSLVKNLGISTKGNPDLTIRTYESFGVDEARELKDAQTRAGFGADKKIFIVGAEVFTHEAQNALLKTFEEPTPNTHFFLILPRAEILIPTLLSRVLLVLGTKNTEDEALDLAKKFLDASLEDRFALSKKLSDKKDRETADRELFRRIFDHIERILYTKMAGLHTDKDGDIFRELFQVKTYLSDRGSSPKILLDHISIVLPVNV